MSEITAIGVYASPVKRGSDAGGMKARLYAHYRSVLLPRTEEYMRALFESQYPGGRFVDVGTETDWLAKIPSATTIVLLYPDPIGFGFADVERQVRARKSPLAALRALTGRRRSFLLSPSKRFQLAVRRLLTRFLVAEAVLGTIVLVATPVLLAVDFLRGRR